MNPFTVVGPGFEGGTVTVSPSNPAQPPLGSHFTCMVQSLTSLPISSKFSPRGDLGTQHFKFQTSSCSNRYSKPWIGGIPALTSITSCEFVLIISDDLSFKSRLPVSREPILLEGVMTQVPSREGEPAPLAQGSASPQDGKVAMLRFLQVA